MKTNPLAIIAAAVLLSSCAGTEYVFKGMIDTPYGSASSDGQTITVDPRPIIVPSK